MFYSRLNMCTLKPNLRDTLSSLALRETRYPGRMMDATVCNSVSAEKHTTPKTLREVYE